MAVRGEADPALSRISVSDSFLDLDGVHLDVTAEMRHDHDGAHQGHEQQSPGDLHGGQVFAKQNLSQNGDVFRSEHAGVQLGGRRRWPFEFRILKYADDRQRRCWAPGRRTR